MPIPKKVYRGTLLKKRERLYREFKREKTVFGEQPESLLMLRKSFLQRLRQAEKELSRIMPSKQIALELEGSPEKRWREFKEVSERERALLKKYPLSLIKEEKYFERANRALRKAIEIDKKVFRKLRERFGIKAKKKKNKITVFIPKNANTQLLEKIVIELNSVLSEKKKNIALAIKNIEELRLNAEISQEMTYLRELGRLFVRVETEIEQASSPHLEKLASFLLKLTRTGFKPGKRYEIKW